MTVPEPLVSNPVAASRPGGKSIQAYIDEQPVWADGTAVDMTPMTAMQWRILILAAAGKFFEGFVVFLTGVALPLMVEEFNIGATQHGLISAASLFGILIGALLLGGLADRFGRKPMFIAEMIIFVVFLCLLVATPPSWPHSFALVVFSLFGIGVALGCDYPTAHLIISESIPTSDRGRLVLDGIRMSGTWNADRHCCRICHPQECARDWCLALDVCHGDHPGCDCGIRPVLRH